MNPPKAEILAIIPTQIELPKTKSFELWKLKDELWIPKLKEWINSLPKWLDDRDIIELTEEELKELRQKIWDWNIQANELFNKFLEKKLDKIKAQTQEWTQRLKDTIKELKEKAENAGQSLWLMEKMLVKIDEWQKSDNYLLQILWSILGFLAGLLGFNIWKDLKDKASKVWDVATDELAKAKDKVKKSMEQSMETLVWLKWKKSLGDILGHPVLKKNMEKAINDKNIFPDDFWVELNNDINSWKIKEEDINWEVVKARLNKYGDWPKKSKELNRILLDDWWKEAIEMVLQKKFIEECEKRYHLK